MPLNCSCAALNSCRTRQSAHSSSSVACRRCPGVPHPACLRGKASSDLSPHPALSRARAAERCSCHLSVDPCRARVASGPRDLQLRTVAVVEVERRGRLAWPRRRSTSGRPFERQPELRPTSGKRHGGGPDCSRQRAGRPGGGPPAAAGRGRRRADEDCSHDSEADGSSNRRLRPRTAPIPGVTLAARSQLPGSGCSRTGIRVVRPCREVSAPPRG